MHNNCDKKRNPDLSLRHQHPSKTSPYGTFILPQQNNPSTSPLVQKSFSFAYVLIGIPTSFVQKNNLFIWKHL